jgi:hypothetical protein
MAVLKRKKKNPRPQNLSMTHGAIARQNPSDSQALAVVKENSASTVIVTDSHDHSA